MKQKAAAAADGRRGPQRHQVVRDAAVEETVSPMG